MEIGNQSIHAAPLVAGVNEDVGIATERRYLAIATFHASALQAANARRSHGDHAFTGGLRLANLLAGRVGHLDPLAVHVVFEDVVHPHRLEGARTNVQRHESTVDAFFGQGVQQRLVEVKASGRCRNGTIAAGVDGLVALAVAQLVFPGDIGRQRHMAVLFQQCDHWRVA